ncbi:energy-coupling factor transporter ATPase [uncultured Thermanaerothrix sp.]|uniref:ABC transporter ATP-binding protein n=1 Tax=uncultured Thermanaerothrix sp. TaxID=1195149 RepID=UPI0026355F37|nr:energy-coupling factor transporter ATPase [uncultured Thermanaerothrix sp.]
MEQPIISIKDLTYRYRGQKRNAIEHISLDVMPSEFIAIMGASEAGKSTLAASINGLVPHFFRGKFSGEVQVCGKSTHASRVAEMAEVTGMVFQDFEAQLFSTNVELEVAFGLENFNVPREEITRRVDEALRFVGLENLKRRSPATLSGGQKQKLAIASVLAMYPKVLVMDEPTTDLDPISKAGVFEIANHLRQRDDLTLLVVEHETEEVLEAQKILLLDEGKLICYAPAHEVLRNVELLEQHGVMPLGVTKYFHQMGVDSDIPLTVNDGIRCFKEKQWRFSDSTYLSLQQQDRAREQHYGAPLIRCENLQFAYPNGTRALKGIDLEIRRGEIVAIVGQNGSGKTTLVKHFNGLLMPTDGQIWVDGRTTREQGVFELGHKVGYVFQNPDHQIFSNTVYDEVAFTLRLRKVDEKTIRQAVTEALDAVGLAGYENADPFSLTKSGRQRVAVASVLAAKPEILILDEPTTGLDYNEQRSMMNLVRRLNENGSTIIFVTHHMWVVAEYAHRVYVMKDGQIYLQGTTREVFSHDQELVDAYLRPPMHVTFANRLGKTLLTVDELVACTETNSQE